MEKLTAGKNLGKLLTVVKCHGHLAKNKINKAVNLLKNMDIVLLLFNTVESFSKLHLIDDCCLSCIISY